MLVAIVFIIISIAVSVLVNEYLVGQRVETLRKDMSNVAVQVSPYLAQSDAAEMYNIARANSSETSRMLILNESGIVQTDSRSELNGIKLSQNEVNDIIYGRNSSSHGFHRIYGDDGEYFWAIYTTASIPSDGRSIGVVLHSSSMEDVVRETDSLSMQMLMMYLVASIIIIFSSMIITSFITKPIQQLTSVAMKISSGNFDDRVKIKGRNELAELGQAFNIMCDRLHNSDQQKSEFVSDASHELKTPLASMKILVESLLYQDNVDEKIYKEFLADINGEIDRLSTLITDLLLISKMDSDILTINTERVPLREIVEKSVSALKPIARSRDVSLYYADMDDTEIDCDPLKLRQAINNLIENAIKYSKERGHVLVSIKRYGQEVHLRIEDNGVGMSAEHLNHIFDRFYRVDKARSRETGGTGLGLHIVRRIAHMHGGRVEVESVEGEGSVFTLILPVVQDKPEATEGEE